MIWVGLACLTLLRLVLAGLTPLAPDEAYYWVWSRALAAGYLDHPPMVALWIWAGTWVAGEGRFGIRLLAPLAGAVGSVLLWQAGRDLLPGDERSGRAVWLLNATLLFGVGSVTMTPDTPLLFFWTAALWALGRLRRTRRGVWWLVAGLAAGLALCSKYTAVLLPFGVGLWVVMQPAARRWLGRWESWAGGLLAVLVFLPTVLWNAEHGWVSFAKQGGRGLVWNPADAARYLEELVGGQVGLATPLVFLLLAVGVGAAGVATLRRRDAGLALLAALSVPPVLLFVVHAFGDRVQANWPAIIYPAAAISAAGLGGWWRRLYPPAVVLGLAMTLAVYLQAIAAPIQLPPRLDPTARLAGWRDLSAAVAADAKDDAFVAADTYGDAAMLAQLLPGEMRVVGVEPRWALFALPDARGAMAGRHGLLVRSAHRTDPPDPADWASIVPRGDIARSRNGAELELFHLYDVVGRPARAAGGEPAVLLPRPGWR